MISSLAFYSRRFITSNFNHSLINITSIASFSTGPFSDFGSHQFDNATMKSYFGEGLYNKFLNASKGESGLSEKDQDQVSYF